MDIQEAVKDLVKKLLFRVTSILNGNPLSFAFQWTSFAVLYTADQIILFFRILIAVSFRLAFGIWPKSLNVVPFQVCAKDIYYEDPGVLEMRALLQGKDCFGTFLEQQQKLPFPPPEYDPYDKVYLASYFHGIIRTLGRVHMLLIKYGGIVYQTINNLFFFQKIVNYISTRVAVNID